MPELAIVDSNTLCSIGLSSLITEVMPEASVRIFHTFSDLICDTPDSYYHFFVSSQIYFEHTSFFLERKQRCIILVQGDDIPQLTGLHTLNTNQDEQHIITSLYKLHQYGHPIKTETINKESNGLSSREIEVLTLIAKGYINKEIAEKLNISLTTVITHRKNIIEKTGIKSVSGLTIYSIMQGHIEADAI